MPKTLNIFTRAITAQAKGDEKEAADLFQEVILNAPQYYQAYSYLGELLSKMGRTGESIDILTKGRNLAEKFNDKEYVDIFAKHLGFVSSVLKTAAPATEGPQEAPPPAGLKPEDFFLFDVSSGVEGESERADDAPTVEQTPSPSGKAAPWDAPAPVDPQEASVPVGVRDKGLPSWVVFDQETPSPGGAEAASTISAYTAAPLSVMGFQSSQINADAMGEVAPKKGEAPAPAPVAPMDDMAGWFLEGDKAVEDALAQPDLQAVDEEIPPPEEPSPVQLPFPGGISMKSLEPAPAEDDLEGPPSLESEMEASLAMEMPFDEADLEFADQDLESLIGPEDEVDFLSAVPDAPPWDAMDSALESKVSMIERFLSLHKVKQAELELSKLEETAPHHPRVIRLKAELAREKGEWDEFVALWDAYMDAGAPRTGENVLTLVDGLEKAGQIERAISLCQDLLDQDASNIDVAILFADLLVKGGKGKDAVSQLQKLIRLKPSVPRFILSLARTYREMGKFSLATVQYQKLLKLAETPEVFNELGSNLEMSGEIDAAIECYAKAAEIASENLLANVSAILLYKQKLELKNAASFCHRLLESEDLPEDITQAIHKELDTLGRAGKKSGGEAASLLDTDEEREITALLLEFREVLQEEETAATMDLVLTQEEEREPEYQPEPDTGKTPAKPAPKAAKAGSKSKSAKGGSKSKTAAKSKSTATKNKK
jgi:tetratricopeptide (TPR) repeat protein